MYKFTICRFGQTYFDTKNSEKLQESITQRKKFYSSSINKLIVIVTKMLTKTSRVRIVIWNFHRTVGDRMNIGAYLLNITVEYSSN